MADETTKYARHVASVFKRLKEGDTRDLGGPALEILERDAARAILVPVIAQTIGNDYEIDLLAHWRQENQLAFPERFIVTTEGTRQWFKDHVLAAQDRMLFWVKSLDNEYIGHLGLFRFDFEACVCELDNVIRGRADLLPGIMTPALLTLLKWTFDVLKTSEVRLRVLAQNDRALKLYARTDFKKIGEIPLYRKTLPDGSLRWVEEKSRPEQEPERTYIVMRCSRP